MKFDLNRVLWKVFRILETRFPALVKCKIDRTRCIYKYSCASGCSLLKTEKVRATSYTVLVVVLTFKIIQGQ